MYFTKMKSQSVVIEVLLHQASFVHLERFYLVGADFAFPVFISDFFFSDDVESEFSLSWIYCLSISVVYFLET